MSRANVVRPSRRLAAGAAALIILIAAGALILSRRHHSPLPGAGSQQYQQMVSAFYTGLIAMNVGDNATALAQLQRATRIVPREPAGWADLGLYQLRQDNTSQAQISIATAHDLAPDSAAIEMFVGYVDRAQGRYDAAVQDFQRAVQINPSDLRARYAVVQALQQQAGPNADAQIERQLDAILSAQPDNLYVTIEAAELAARDAEAGRLQAIVSRIAPRLSWSPDVLKQLQTLRADAKKSDTRAAAIDLIQLDNLLKDDFTYQAGRRAVADADNVVGKPIDHFLALPSPSPTPAPPDSAMSFAAKPLISASSGAGDWTYARSAYLRAASPASLIVANGRAVTISTPGETGAIAANLPFPGGPSATPPTPSGIVPVDWNSDSNMGLVFAGAGGLRLYRQISRVPGGAMTFKDVTAQAKLPPAILDGSYTGVWPVDIDSDGDLDLVLGAGHGPPIVLRNNSDGTFTPIHPFPGATNGLSGFAWADFDSDGNPDAALIDGSGHLHVYQNQLGGVFKEWPIPSRVGPVEAVSAADVHRTGQFSLVVLGLDGAITTVTRSGVHWTTAPLAQAGPMPADGTARLYWADLDNNGSLDLVATSSAGTRVWLSDQSGAMTPLASQPTARTATVDEQDDQGRVDLLSIHRGQAVHLVNHGTRRYAWQQIRLRAAQTADHRNNTFGIGGLIELRAGLLYEEQMVTHPVTHFGLGTMPQANAVRITWPNGVTQGEFALKPDQIAEAPERLKGSCPWLFAWDGHKFNFVTDFLWRSALGLRINAQQTAGVVMTGDWNKIEGDQLAARDGFYDLRLCTELWETYYFDKIALMTVDHPADTDIWVDERFSIPPPRLKYEVTSRPRPIARAIDDLGNDVTRAVSARDGVYLDTFGRGAYQGITRDHYVEIDLGSSFPTSGRQWLLCNGWIHPTDSSVNLAISQGRHVAPSAVSVEVLDGRGGWRVALPHFGFPEGKNKTTLIPLTGLFALGAPHRLRLRTNMEIYWDWIGWATGLPWTPSRARTIAPDVADLRSHGFDKITTANRSSPDIPHYGQIEQQTQRWLDMTGDYTRYGDVRPLLKSIDDRYVIMDAGDEIALRFTAPPPPPSGWKRDYILVGDGWGKDCDHNSSFSRTVLPLPYHADRFYTRPPGRLEAEPAYKMHPQDWATYQTRSVTPEQFQQAMRP